MERKEREGKRREGRERKGREIKGKYLLFVLEGMEGKRREIGVFSSNFFNFREIGTLIKYPSNPSNLLPVRLCINSYCITVIYIGQLLY